MDSVAVNGNRRLLDLAEFVAEDRGLHYTACAAFRRFAIRRFCIVDPEGDITHTVAVNLDVVTDRVFGLKGSGDDETDLVLLKDIRRSVPHTRFKSGIRDELEPKDRSVVKGRLLGIA